MGELIIDTIIEKLDATETRLGEREREISEMNKKLAAVTDQSSAIKHLVDLVTLLQNNMKTITWPVREMIEMSSRLARNNELLANPRETKQVVFHRIGKWISVIIGFLIVTTLLTISWLNTSRRLARYQMNDILWRYIKISNHSENLVYLESIEKSYHINPEKFQSFVETGELRALLIKDSVESGNKTANIDHATLANADTINAGHRKKPHKATGRNK